MVVCKFIMGNLTQNLTKDGSSCTERLQRDCVIASRVLAQYVYPQAYKRAARVVGNFLEGFMHRKKLLCQFNDFGRRVLQKHAGRFKSYLQNIRLYRHELRHTFYKVYKIQNRISRTMFPMVDKQVMDNMVLGYVELRKQNYSTQLQDWYEKYFKGTKVGDLDNWVNSQKEFCPKMFVSDHEDIIEYIKLHKDSDEIKPPKRKGTRLKSKKLPTSKGSLRITVANKDKSNSANFKRSLTKIPGKAMRKITIDTQKSGLSRKHTNKSGEPEFN
jgi:hypothetical protein